MSESRSGMGFIGMVARTVAIVMLAYWAVYALVAPVTNLDSQMYNLARIELAARGGLFGNPLFTSVFHLAWPWTFDAVHLPFMALGFCYALPSYFCFLGICYVAHAMIREQLGRDAAWMAVTALLALTCLVYQATSTKNDIALVFCGAVWLYAQWRWRRERRPSHLLWAVLALGFMSGTKTTGVVYAVILGAVTLWHLKSDPRRRLTVGVGLVAAALVFGSVETYVETARRYGHPMGSSAIVDAHRNRDGVRGGIANLSRYVVGSVYLGPAMPGVGIGLVPRLVGFERLLLQRMGLEHVGFDGHAAEQSFFYYQSGFEELSGFGPMGTLAMAAMVASILFWRRRALWWRLAVAGAGGLTITSATLGYSLWGNRYLIGWYALGTLAVVCFAWETETRFRRSVRWLILLASSAGAVAAPLLSFNRCPTAICDALMARDRLETTAYPLQGRVRERLRELRLKAPASRIYYVACNDSIILPILEDRSLDAVVVTPPQFSAILANGDLREGDVVIEDWPILDARLVPFEVISAPDVYSRGRVREQTLYRVMLAR